VQDDDRGSTNGFRTAEESLRNGLRFGKLLTNLSNVSVGPVPNALSARRILEYAKLLGFRNEAKGLFKDYPNNGLRPDYFKIIGPTGSILEVERGKTNINNLDFLDFGSAISVSMAVTYS
jgi:hypothetical protein